MFLGNCWPRRSPHQNENIQRVLLPTSGQTIDTCLKWNINCYEKECGLSDLKGLEEVPCVKIQFSDLYLFDSKPPIRDTAGIGSPNAQYLAKQQISCPPCRLIQERFLEREVATRNCCIRFVPEMSLLTYNCLHGFMWLFS